MSKLDRLVWAVTEWFEVEDYVFGVRTTSPAFGEWLRYTLGEYWIGSGERDDKDALYACIVEDATSASGRKGSKRFHVLYYGTWDIVRTLDVRALARTLLHEIDSVTYPIRDDAVYLEASVIRGNGRTLLIPAVMVPQLSAAGRRLESKIDITLPGVMSVALDPETGYLIPPVPQLRFAQGWERRLDELIPPTGPEERRALVTEATPVDRVLTWGQLPEVAVLPTAKGPALFDYAQMLRNPAMVGAAGLTTLAKVFEGAECVATRFLPGQGLVDGMRAALDGGHWHHVTDGSRTTAEGP